MPVRRTPATAALHPKKAEIMKSGLPAGTRVDGAYVTFHFMDEKSRTETVMSVPARSDESALIEMIFEELKATFAADQDRRCRPMTKAGIDAFRHRIAPSVIS